MASWNNTDRDWITWGEANPYFGVVTHPQFLKENINENSLKEFFASGVAHVEHVYTVIRSHVKPDFQPSRILDYGCGVGRLVVPFAKHAPTVVGIDVAPGMLEQARKNCEDFDVRSAQLFHVDDMESLEPASFGLVHSYIVFQHIPVARGETILRKLIALIEEGGVGAIHFTCSYPGSRSPLRRWGRALSQRIRLARGLLNIARKLPFSTPPMQMNEYSMNRIFDIFIDEHCSNLHVEFSEHVGTRGAMLYFQKSERALL